LLADSPSSFVHDKNVADFEPPQAGTTASSV
jgi:hypothetical protein